MLINNELDKVYTWLCVNRLSLNIEKTKFIILHNKGKIIDDNLLQVKLLQLPIERVKTFNFLGITLGQNLTWRNHIDIVCSKVSRYIGLFVKLKHVLPCYILNTLYNSLIASHLTYGILAWGMNASSLFKLQKKIIRIITNNKFNAHTDPIFKSLGFLKLQDLYRLNVLKFYYKHCHNQLPHFLQSFVFNHRFNVHDYSTRNRNIFNICQTRVKCAEYSLRNITPKILNETPQIKDKIWTHSLHGFVWYIKCYFINVYNTYCTIANCYICAV